MRDRTKSRIRVVSDPSGAAVPEAFVRLFNERTQFHRETTTDGEGNYRLLDIPVGDYRLEFEKTGFSKVLRSGISLSAGHSLRVDCQLVLGSVAQRSDGRFEVRFRLFDVLKQTQLGGVAYTLAPNQVRAA